MFSSLQVELSAAPVSARGVESLTFVSKAARSIEPCIVYSPSVLVVVDLVARLHSEPTWDRSEMGARIEEGYEVSL